MAMPKQDELLDTSISNTKKTNQNGLGIRDTLVNQYGIDTNDISWNDLGDKGGTVKLYGNDFLSVNENQINDGTSYADESAFNSALDQYKSTYGNSFNQKTTETPQVAATKEDSAQNREYISPYTKSLDELYQNVLNYKYDPTTDASYKALEEQYTTQGNRAMQDTMANTTALTGGRPSSYSQTAGQQQYNQYMEGLASQIPALEAQGYSRLYDQLGLTQTLDNTAYSRFADNKNFDYGVQRDEISDQQYQQTFDYGVGRDEVSDTQYQEGYDRDVLESDRNYDFDQEEFAYKKLQDSLDRSSSGSGSGYSSGSSSSATTAEDLNNYNSLKNLLAQGRVEGSQAIEYLSTKKDEIIDKYGETAYNMVTEQVAEKLYNPQVKTAATIKEEKANAAAEEQANAEANAEPEMSQGAKYGATVKFLDGMTPQKALNELTNGASVYADDNGIGQKNYDALVAKYEEAVQKEQDDAELETNDDGFFKKLYNRIAN